MLHQLYEESLRCVSSHSWTCNWSQPTSDREVPWNECNSNTNGLLDGEDSTIRCRWCLDSALDTFGLTSEPPRKTESIVEFALSFEEWLSSLVSDNVCQVVTVFPNQRVPFEQTLGTSSRVDFAEGLESFVCCCDSCVGVFCDVVWCGCPYFAVAGIYC